MSAETSRPLRRSRPKALVRHRIIAVVGVVLLLASSVLVIKGLANPANNQLTAAKWVPFLEWSSWKNYLIPGLIGTLQAAAISVVLAVIAGSCSAWAGSRRWRLVRIALRGLRRVLPLRARC